MALSRDEILKRADDLPTREVPVPEWGEGASVNVRCLTAAERLQFGQAAQKADDGGPNPTALIVALGAVDDMGERLFQIQDTERLADMRGDVLDKLATAVMDLSGLGDDKAAEAEENSDATPSGGTPFASDGPSDAPSPNSETD